MGSVGFLGSAGSLGLLPPLPGALVALLPPLPTPPSACVPPLTRGSQAHGAAPALDEKSFPWSCFFLRRIQVLLFFFF